MRGLLFPLLSTFANIQEKLINKIVYDLPPTLLSSLTIRTGSDSTNEQHATATSPSVSSSYRERTKDINHYGNSNNKDTIPWLPSTPIPTIPETEPGTGTAPTNQSLDSPSSQSAPRSSCSLCGVIYTTVQEHRLHARSDHHRYNVKAQLRGNRTFSEAEFAKAIAEIDESISGSETESDSSEEEEKEKDDHKASPEYGVENRGNGDRGGEGDSTWMVLLRQQAKKEGVSATSTLGRSNKDEGGRRVITNRQPLVWFGSHLFPSNISLGAYRALFTVEEQDEPSHFVEYLQKKQTIPIQRRGGDPTLTAGSESNLIQGPHIFMCMIGGGHFAAMIVGLSPEIQKKQGGVEERQARVLAHKTFHRYTTRRKQGGAQSANDAAKGNAHSAGSSLRRYNEAALEKEIRELLADWKPLIDKAQLLFVRATGSTNRRTLFGPYDGQVLQSNDPRIRGFPFSTRRATQSELMRCFKELTRMKVSRVDEAALSAAVERSRKQEESSSTPPKPSQTRSPQPRLSEEEETAILHTSQIQALIRRSKAPALLSYLSNHTISPSFAFYPPNSAQNHHSPTPLHLAASSNSPALITALLMKAKLDPTMLNAEGKTPFDLARDRNTRDAFRVARHELGENAWNWDAAHVPVPLSKAEADDRSAREKAMAAEEEATRRRTETERLKREEAEAQVDARRNKTGGGKVLGALEKTGSQKREEESRGMTPEMRMRLERERRARAAEERIRRMQGS